MKRGIAIDNNLLSLLDYWENENSEKNDVEARMYQYFDIKARRQGVPIGGTFELTPFCNLDCKMCYVHLTGGQMEKTQKKILTGEQWKSIIDQTVEAGLFYVLLTGGEAMMHPDFDEIYLYLQEKGIAITINTNGVLLTDDRIEFFKKHRPKGIKITLYGYDDDSYEAVTGKRIYSTVVTAIHKSIAAGLNVRICLTPNRYLNGRWDQLIDLAESFGVRFDINSSLSEPRDETERNGQAHDLDIDEYVELYKYIYQKRGCMIKPTKKESLPSPGGNTKGELKGFRCGGGKSTFSVLWNGMMQPCLSFSESQIDLTVTAFKEAWKTINTIVCNYLIPVECEGCAYFAFCTPCVVQHALGAPKGHANPKICDRTQRLIAEGLEQFDKCDG